VNSNGNVQYTFYLFHPANLDNLGIIGDSINNSVKYMTPTLYGFTASAMYGFDDSSTQPGRVASVDIVYSQGPLRASAVYSSWRNHAIPLVSGLGLNSLLGQPLSVGQTFVAKTQDIFGSVCTLQGYVEARSARCTHAGGSFHGDTIRTDADSGTRCGLSRHRGQFTDARGYLSWLARTRFAELGVGDAYALSKRTIVYLTCQHTDGTGDAAMPLLAPSDNPNQTAFRIGIHHFF
jgi:predicted porin